MFISSPVSCHLFDLFFQEQPSLMPTLTPPLEIINLMRLWMEAWDVVCIRACVLGTFTHAQSASVSARPDALLVGGFGYEINSTSN